MRIIILCFVPLVLILSVIVSASSLDFSDLDNTVVSGVDSFLAQPLELPSWLQLFASFLGLSDGMSMQEVVITCALWLVLFLFALVILFDFLSGTPKVISFLLALAFTSLLGYGGALTESADFLLNVFNFSFLADYAFAELVFIFLVLVLASWLLSALVRSAHKAALLRVSEVESEKAGMMLRMFSRLYDAVARRRA